MAPNASARPFQPSAAPHARRTAISASATGMTHSLIQTGSPIASTSPCWRSASTTPQAEYASTPQTAAATAEENRRAASRAFACPSASAVESVRCRRSREASRPPRKASQSVSCAR